MPEVAQERTAWRDEDISQWHRTLGWDCPAIDVDFLLLEYDKGEGVAFVEYKRETAQPQNLKHPSYKALAGVADKAELPFFIVRYAGDRSWFKVRAVNKYAKEYLLQPALYSEAEYIEFLYMLRGRIAPSSVLVGRHGTTVQLDIEKHNLQNENERLYNNSAKTGLSRGANKVLLFLFFLLSILAFGCDNNQWREDYERDQQERIKNRIEYVRDERTGLCFAYVYFEGSGGISITCVPCDSVARVLAGGGK